MNIYSYTKIKIYFGDYMEKTLKYTCKTCGFTWITLNGEHSICPKCHSEDILFLEEVKDLDIDAILSHNRRRGGCCGSARGKGPLTCGKPAPDHHNPDEPHDPKTCCGHRA